MSREWRVVALVLMTGCSLFVKFDDKDIPKDAPPDGFAPIDAALCGFDEPNDDFATAVAVAPGMTGPAAICPNFDGTVTDVDFYKVTIPDGTASATFSISFEQADQQDLDLILLSADGATMLGASRGVGSGETVTCPGISPACAALAAGDVLVEVLPGAQDNYNTYTLNVEITAGSGSGSGT